PAHGARPPRARQGLGVGAGPLHHLACGARAWGHGGGDVQRGGRHHLHRAAGALMRGSLLTWCLLVAVVCGCAPAPTPRGVVRFDPKSFPSSIEGPMPGFGPFDSFADALIAACPLILSLPRATAGRRDEQGFNVRWRVSAEYCAWMYYTPDDKYEMSM